MRRCPDWCALAEDEALNLYDGWGGFPLPGALNNLAIKLAKLRGSVSG
jgi:hypothetical protein